MFDGKTRREVENAIDELVKTVGVRMDVPLYGLTSLLRSWQTQKCVGEIARLLGLPIRIELAYFGGQNDPLRTSARASGTGRVAAQVEVPPNLPLYGSAAFNGLPIKVYVSANCHNHPESFVAIMAHELSHVILAALKSPRRDSEWYTDLVPIILGFREAVLKGRVVTEKIRNFSSTTIHTTRYGYLSDRQFSYAYDYAARCIDPRVRERSNALRMVGRIKELMRKGTSSVTIYRNDLAQLDLRTPKRMNLQDAEKIVRLHDRDYSIEWENRLKSAVADLTLIESLVEGLISFGNAPSDQLNEYTAVLDAMARRVGIVINEIAETNKILEHYVGIMYRLRRALAGEDTGSPSSSDTSGPRLRGEWSERRS
jgi:hypothetical protein